MQDLSRRVVFHALLLTGGLTAGIAIFEWLQALREAAAPIELMGHRQSMLVLLGVAVAASAFVPSLRPAAVGAALLSKLAFLMIAFTSAPALPATFWFEAALVAGLAGIATALLREAVHEARWNGVLPLRPEA